LSGFFCGGIVRLFQIGVILQHEQTGFVQIAVFLNLGFLRG
jgi:hypothetical protein